jgi:hypothetical protein
MPKLKHSEVESVDLDKLGKYVKNLSQSNFDFSDNDRIEDWLLEQADEPLPQDNEDADNDE